MGPSLETGASFRCCTVGELLRDSDWVSVIAVREKCDEKGFSVLSKKTALYSPVKLAHAPGLQKRI
jgi:hypothetical protein